MTALPPDTLSSATSASDSLPSPPPHGQVAANVVAVVSLPNPERFADPSRRLKRVAGMCALAALCTSYFVAASQSTRKQADDDAVISMQRLDDETVAQRRGIQPTSSSGAKEGSRRAVTGTTTMPVLDAMHAAAAAAGLEVRSTIVESSFDASARQAGLDPATALKVAHAFNGAIDFRHDLRKGDTITFLFHATDSATAPARPAVPVPDTTLPVAVKIGDGKDGAEVFLYQKLGGEPLYYAKDGTSAKPAFSRYPVAFTRVSSPFSLRRLDPVTHRWQAHEGVDLAAPYGTPIRATANGRVVYAGWKSGYGKVVEIQNAPPYSTRFAHMSRFHKGLRAGQTVKRGNVIGYVGTTGWSTGPHLHYEVRVNQVAMNPLTVPLPRDTRLAGDDKQRFVARAKALAALM
ncbi:peptidoglycan DD-metalloendopeptidase family protein [Robbsia andropogonis]|uniref:peptidoglycan DD-metalloendopeptidase family protein n=1 Tax=Robbsia andropogonis TaxID=28092 RepID=UPI000463BDBD|nr:peptidoglycan DD-metalloendopeptidase family protein [Robbsia andropogonis]